MESSKRSTSPLESDKAKQSKLSAQSEAPKYKLRQLNKHSTRRTNDEVHSSIVMGPVLTALLDTPQMQRLRDIKQLGTAEHVYINVNHNRFEHSLGVSHLAGRLAKRIQELQPSLRCTDKDVLCVQLAGLMHDIGHGPFSHVYEDFVHKHSTRIEQDQELAQIYQSSPDYEHWPKHEKPWTHEDASLMMIDAALAHLGLAIDTNFPDEPLKQIGDGVDAKSMRAFGNVPEDQQILTSRDFIFIKECIMGGPIPSYERIFGAEGFHGRKEPYQEWLYDIVSNRHSGLDVDKVDYFARDQRRALRESGEIDKVMVDEAVVAWGDCTAPGRKCALCSKIKENQHLMLVYPMKLVGATMEFFRMRHSLHSKIYRHKTNDGTNYMVKEILCMADPYFKIRSTPLTCNGESKSAYSELPPSRAVLDPRSYLRLRDCIINEIESTTSKELAPARHLVHRIWSRDLYKCVHQQILQCEKHAHQRIWEMSPDEIAADVCSLQGSHGGATISRDDIIIDKCQVHHGLKDHDPISRMRFLKKKDMDLLSKDNFVDLPTADQVDQSEYASRLPKKFMQRSLRVFSRDSSSDKCDLMQHQFMQWFDSACLCIEMTDGPDSQDDDSRPIMLTQDDSDRDEVSMQQRISYPDTPMNITPQKPKASHYDL